MKNADSIILGAVRFHFGLAMHYTVYEGDYEEGGTKIFIGQLKASDGRMDPSVVISPKPKLARILNYPTVEDSKKNS